jgi:hypothetical protein
MQSSHALMPPPPAPRETVLASWIHVSDLHFGHGDASHQWNQKRVLEELLVDAQALVQNGLIPRPGLIFATGDIAFSGGARAPVAGQGEYEMASEWFRQLQQILAVPSERVFAVPGNHDVDRGTDADVRRLLRGARAGDETIDEILQAPRDLDRLRGRMSRYLAFARSFGSPAADRFHDGLWWRQRVDLAEGVSLRVCGLNTALLSLDDQDQGKLRVGQRQLAELFVPTPGVHELAVVLGHHPVNGGWLADEKETRGQLDRHAAIHLFGHLHETDSEQARHGWGTGCLRIAAGAAHAEARSIDAPPGGHGYNFGVLVVLDSGDLAVRIWPRRWSSRSYRFVADVDNTMEHREHAEHRLPGKYRIRRAPPTVGRQSAAGHVWRADDVKSGEAVAVKIILPPPGTYGEIEIALDRGRKAAIELRLRVTDPGSDAELAPTHGPAAIDVEASARGAGRRGRLWPAPHGAGLLRTKMCANRYLTAQAGFERGGLSIPGSRKPLTVLGRGVARASLGAAARSEDPCTNGDFRANPAVSFHDEPGFAPGPAPAAYADSVR